MVRNRMDVTTLEAALLNSMRRRQFASLAQIAETLGIARSTAGRRVDSLIERGFLIEGDADDDAPPSRIRRPVEFNPRVGGFVGIDFDARSVNGVVIDFAHDVVTKNSVPLPSEPTAKTVLETVRDLEADLLGTVGDLPMLGYGMGLPGRVERDARRALDYAFIKYWTNIDLADALEKPAGQLRIENNTRAAALGEFWFGRNRGVEDLVCLSVRTGISSAMIAHGRLISGAHEMAGEIRCWPAWNPLGESRLSRTIEDTATFRSIAGDKANGWRRFCDAVSEDDPAALEILQEIASIHGGAAALALQFCDPTALVISGFFVELGGTYLEFVKKSVDAALEDHWLRRPDIQLSTLGEYSGALGAAALASEHFSPGG